MFYNKTPGDAAQIAINIVFSLIITCLLGLFVGRMFLLSDGQIDGKLYGFSVDNEERIYIGTSSAIKVYKDFTLIKTISLPTSRAYCFFINNDKLYIGCASDNKGGIYDLEGNEIEYGNYTYSQILRESRDKIIHINDHEYVLTSNMFGSYYVTRDGVIAYQSDNSFFDGFSYWFTIALLTIIFVFFVFLKLEKMKSI